VVVAVDKPDDRDCTGFLSAGVGVVLASRRNVRVPASAVAGPPEPAPVGT